jgi:hypothetical protein
MPATTCPQCSKSFTTTSNNQLFCSKRCGDAHRFANYTRLPYLDMVPELASSESEIIEYVEKNEGGAEELRATDIVWRRAAMVRAARVAWEREHGPVGVGAEMEVDDGF